MGWSANWRQRAASLLGVHAVLLWAALAGLLGALATIVFRDGLSALQVLLLGRAGSFVDIAATLPWPVRVAMPCGGGLLAGILLVAARRFGTGIRVDYMEAIAVGDGQVPLRQTLLNSLSSLLSIASGGSIGREGSMVQLAALTASLIGRGTGLSPTRLRLLVACGAAAGVTAAYNAPIASAFFITEIVLGAIVMDSLGPIMVAAVVANITMRRLPGYRPTYEMPPFAPVANLDLLWFLVLGVLAGLAAPAFLGALRRARSAFDAAPLPLPLRLALGGLGVGIISVWVPQVWGNGYSVVNSLLHTTWLWQAVLVVLLAKVVATLCTCGSGAVGGIFTPTLFVGAAIGYLFALAVHTVAPGSAEPAAYAMVGMGAMLAAASSAPLMAILMIFEMTLSYQVMLPLMLSCVVAYFVARTVAGASMYGITARRAAAEQARARLRGTRMRELVRPAQTVLPLQAPLSQASALFEQFPVKYLYLVDDGQRYRGVLALRDLAGALREPDGATRPCAALLLPAQVALLTPDMTLDEALRAFMEHHGERLPTVRSRDDPELLGVVYKTDVLDTYVRLNREAAGIRIEG